MYRDMIALAAALSAHHDPSLALVAAPSAHHDPSLPRTGRTLDTCRQEDTHGQQHAMPARGIALSDMASDLARPRQAHQSTASGLPGEWGVLMPPPTGRGAQSSLPAHRCATVAGRVRRQPRPAYRVGAVCTCCLAAPGATRIPAASADRSAPPLQPRAAGAPSRSRRLSGSRTAASSGRGSSSRRKGAAKACCRDTLNPGSLTCTACQPCGCCRLRTLATGTWSLGT